jgi:acyl carrier protein
MESTAANTVFDKVILAVEQTVYLKGLSLTPTTRIANDLRIGKFGRLKLALYLEETFDVELPDEAVESFETVGDIIHYMSRWSHETTDVWARAEAGD